MVSDMQASIRDEWSFEPRPQKARVLRSSEFMVDAMDLTIGVSS